MNPFYFGTQNRRLFGLYTPGRPAAGRVRGAVLCHPWGQEYLRAHRSMKHLASMLTSRGVHVLSFDYFGTGDSAGETSEADLVGWHQDIEMAVEELQDTTDAPRISIIGLRLGATLAAGFAARRREKVDALVLWDPVVSGEEYLRELLPAPGACKPRPAEAGGGFEVLGFPLTEAMLTEFRSIDLQSLVPKIPARTLVVASQTLPSHQDLRTTLAARAAVAPALEHIEAPLPWLKGRDFVSGAVPVAVLHRICDWLD